MSWNRMPARLAQGLLAVVVLLGPGLPGARGQSNQPQIEPSQTNPAPDDGSQTAKALDRRYREAVEFWRAGDHARAGMLWKSLEGDLGPAREPNQAAGPGFSRAALFHALGNAAFRAERPLEAVGYYLRALEHRPRDPGLRRNLTLARTAADVGLEDDRSTLGRVAGVANPTEARWLALFGLIPLAVGGLIEALRGGLIGRLAVVAGLLGALVLATPFLFDRFGPDDPRLLVISPEPALARSEPRQQAARVGEAAPGERLVEIERWPGWVRVELNPRLRAWVPESSVFRLDP